MKRLITILGTLCAILLVVTLLTIQALIDMSSRASYHMQDADKTHQAMEAIMDKVHKDNPDYYLDVLTKSDAYMLYQETTRFN
jgi:hypothetical protein